MINYRRLPCVIAVALLLPDGTAGQTVYSLEQIFATAEARSLQLRPHLSAQREAEQEIKVAHAGWLPDINANLSVSYIGDGFTTERNLSDYQRAPIPHFGNGLSLNIEQPIYTGGAITATIDMAKSQHQAAIQSADLSRNSLRFQLTGYYLDLYKYHTLRHVIEKNIAQAKLVLEEMHSRYNAGTALHNDITRYELLVSNLGLELIKIDNAISIFNHNLVTTAGLPDGTVVSPDTTLLDQSLPVDNVEWWQNEAVNHAPMLQLAKTGIDISNTGKKLAESERLPKIGVKAGWTIDGPILVEVPPINRNLSYWFVGVGINYNLSSLYKSNKKISKARVANINAIDKYDAAKEQLETSVHNNYVKYLEAYQEFKTRQKSVELALQNYDITAVRYANDMALITDMLDAANAKLDAEAQLVNARINIIYHYYQLKFTTGTL